MRFSKLIAAAALAVAGVAGTSATANAAPVSAAATTLASVAVAPSVQDRRYYRDDRRWDRGRHRGWDRPRNYRRSYRSNRVCWKEWRRHQGRVTVCRNRRR